MRIIISPAKKMREDGDTLAPRGLPTFVEEAERLRDTLRAMTAPERQALWRCNDAIAAVNEERLAAMDLRGAQTPAILAYEGIQYQYMAPGVFTGEELDYVQEHLRILSGFYGLLRPFDAVTPYRLEMQARLSVDGGRDLYAFWGRKLADRLAEETDAVLDLASKEYSRAVQPFLPDKVRWITVVFGEEKAGKIVEKGTLCKMARGRMVRWLAENRIRRPEEAQAFGELGYQFSPEHSGEGTYLFIKGDV